MTLSTRFSALPPAHQWLIRQIQDIGFGRLTFIVRGKHPEPALGYRVVHARKLRGSSRSPRTPANRQDFLLRDEQLALLTCVQTLADGTRATIKIADGLPGKAIDIEEEHRPVCSA